MKLFKRREYGPLLFKYVNPLGKRIHETRLSPNGDTLKILDEKGKDVLFEIVYEKDGSVVINDLLPRLILSPDTIEFAHKEFLKSSPFSFDEKNVVERS